MRAASKAIVSWLKDPILFVRENFGVEPDEWQKDVLMAFNQNQRLAMLASKGVGKTTILAWLCWYFLATRPNPKIAATSISWDNLADGLWAEMAKWQARSKFLQENFQWNKTRIACHDAPETWFMSARSWAKGSSNEQQANSLAGLHADYIMFVLDESGGIPDAVMAAAEAALSSGIECKLVQAGNPTHLEGPLYRAASSEKHLWHLTEINSDPNNPKRSPRVSIQWAKEQIEKFGIDNPWVLVNVFGRFPPSSINALLGIDEVKMAMNRKHQSYVYESSQKRLGIDVARMGDDSTVIFPRQGLMAFRPVEIRGARTNEIAARVSMAKSKWQSEMEFVDGTGGFGAGVVDSLIQAGHSPQEIHFSSKADDPQFFNKRAEMWFRMTDWIKRGGSIPNIDRLVRELCAPTYSFKNGKLILEDKDQIKSRLGFSLDYSDALALTFAYPEMSTAVGDLGVLHKLLEREKSFHDQNPIEREDNYDPFSPNRL